MPDLESPVCRPSVSTYQRRDTTRTERMFDRMTDVSTDARLLALTEQLASSLSSASAIRLADQLELVGTEATLDGIAPDGADDAWLHAGLAGMTADRERYWAEELARLKRTGASLVTIDSPAYPRNLRLIANRPPLLFVRGAFSEQDERAIAVVGTRTASREGIRAASGLSAALAERDVTVVSGLAAGIDTAAHSAAVNGGGRTIAVFGTGIDHVFPAANRALARRIEEQGACVSQFWPHQRGAKWTFPVRNVVTSGLSTGTVVIEASETSGAKRQAMDALRHGKRVLLLERLVTNQSWAEALVGHPRVDVADGVDSVVAALDAELDLPDQPQLV